MLSDRYRLDKSHLLRVKSHFASAKIMPRPNFHQLMNKIRRYKHGYNELVNLSVTLMHNEIKIELIKCYAVQVKINIEYIHEKRLEIS